MRIIIRLLFIFILVILGCSKNDEHELCYELPIFADTIGIEGEIINDTFIFETGNLALSARRIIYCGRTDINDMNYHVFDYEGNYIRSFGDLGRGPGEISTPYIPGVLFNDSIYCVFDINYNKKVFFSIDSDTFYEEITQENEKPMLPWLYQLWPNDRSLLFTREKRFVLMSHGDSLDCYNEYPDLTKNDENINVKRGYFAYKTSHAHSDKQNKFVIATRNGAIMQIFNIDSNKIVHNSTKRISKPEYYLSQSQIGSYIPILTSENYIGMYDICANDKYIYATYYQDNDTDVPYIMQFDWEGNPYKLFDVKDEITKFTISPNNLVAFAFKYIDEVPYLCKFTIE